MYLELAHNSKVPKRRGPWKLLTEIPKGNVGLTLEGRTVVDFDDKDAGREFYKLHPELCTVIVETRRGVHYHFGGETKARKFEHGDIKSGEHAYVVYPPSVVDGFEYRFIRQGVLQQFPEELFPAREKIRALTRGPIKNLDAYLATIESIQGKDGSGGLIRAASVCRDAGLSEAQVVLKLQWWNSLPVVSPQWSDSELARAATNVFRKG